MSSRFKVGKEGGVKFSDLAVGDSFIIVDPRERPAYSERCGPFRKVSTRKYRLNDGCEMPIESIGYLVARLDEVKRGRAG